VAGRNGAVLLTGGQAEFDVGLAYEKHPQVAIRPEGFGGLAYHYGNRRLVFLKAPELVTLIESLVDFPSAREALAACVPGPRRKSCERALPSLLASGVIRCRGEDPVRPATVTPPGRA
jgi:mycofactocin biosynthesis protein MftB